MIYCIVGHGASGKTTIQRKLQIEIPSITTYTTRPIRHNEINGNHYHFISNEKFEQLIIEDFFIEHYYIKKNQWYYGLSLKNIDYQNQDFILVIDPNGYKQLLEKVDNNFIKCIFINISERTRIKRMYKRNDNEKEIARRIVADRNDFEDFYLYADVILESSDSDENANTILKFLKASVRNG